MSLRRCCHRSIPALLLLLATAAPCAAEWRRLDSPNFVVIGDVSGGTLRDIAIKFEGFRETLGRVLNSQVTATAVPTVVIVFPDDRAFKPFMPKYEGRTVDVGGLFVPAQDVNYIALDSSGGDEALTIVFHEYSHLITSNVARNLPVWLGEGLAEFYSTFEALTGGKQAKLGRPIQSHILGLANTTLLPLDQLLNVTHSSALYNEGNRRSVFYAQSWALTHMLALGQPSRAPQLAEYVSKIRSGMPAMDAWNQVFDSKAIEEALQRYVRLRVFSYLTATFSEKLAALDVKPLPLAPDDAEAFLADFLLLQQRNAEAQERLGKALKGGPGSAWSATVAALADVANKDYAGAEKRLLALGGDVDWFAGYRAGAAIAEIVEEKRETPNAAQLDAVNRLFAPLATAGRSVPNATARLATIALAADEPPPPTLRTAIERARLMAPGRTDYVFLHARILAELGEFPTARSVLSQLLLPAYPQNVRDAARSLMGYIVQMEKIKANAAPNTAAPAGDTAPAGAPPGADAPSATGSGGGFRPVFRQLGEGEERFEGVLERIDCAKTSVTLHVRSADELVPVTSPDLKSVEFITYRDDLGGSVMCGAVKGTPKVYVTWRRDATNKRVVAVEFLPK